MGFSTFVEVNHDKAHAIEKDPEGFGKLMAEYTCASDPRIATELFVQFGVNVWKTGNRDGEWEEITRDALR